MPRRIPYGFTVDKGERLVPDDKERENLSLMIECRRLGWTWQDIADWLNRARASTER